MAHEIERKFLIDLDRLGKLTGGSSIKQGYISTKDLTTVRIRIKGEQGFLTLKGENRGASRLEFEYPIPVTDAEEILHTLCSRPLIEKNRYEVKHNNWLWEIDIFEGDNSGLVIAELELETEDAVVDLPDWVRVEVTGDPRYYNANLLNYPYRCWSADERQ
ncbi:MAG: CYTH domain-containing protein [Gammaproteobacteria bacterium]|nr:CYTH domain-containing protein [Gammaproteobacteria bacterium]MCW8983061.1 CYTH domain-containing protein [Gammaproteobacteria bacterium]